MTTDSTGCVRAGKELDSFIGKLEDLYGEAKGVEKLLESEKKHEAAKAIYESRDKILEAIKLCYKTF